MEIEIKDKLRTLRQQKNKTQDDLASYLGITYQSVGKWERGEGYPDITLLPRIALYFDVTVDELLGVDSALISKGIHINFLGEGYIPDVTKTRELASNFDAIPDYVISNLRW